MEVENNLQLEQSESKIVLKKFIFKSKRKLDQSPLIVLIPERLEASYGLYVWPSAHLLSWFIFENQKLVKGQKILELGGGTSLPSIVAGFCGAEHVTISDSSKLPHCLEQAEKSVKLNSLEHKINVIGITWGYFLSEVHQLTGKVDLIIGSDCFYDPSVFEDLICTISFILESNPQAKFLTSYQERSGDWSIVPLLKKWGLNCQQILYTELANACEIDLGQLLQGHTIHLFEITLQGHTS